jgi:hypothetical protein
MKQKNESSTNLTPYLKKDYNKYDDIPEETGFEVSCYSGDLLKDVSKPERKEIFNKFTGYTEIREVNGEKVSIHHKGLGMDSDHAIDMAYIMIERGWTWQRLQDAYKHAFSNHVWNTPVMPAEVLLYDKHIKLNTYSEISLRISQYIAIYYNNIYSPLYILKTEQEQYNFTLWDEKYRKSKQRVYIDPKTKEEIIIK